MSSTICFIGAGNMAYSIIGGLVKQGFDAKQLIASDPSENSLAKMAELGVSTTHDNIEAIQGADVVVLAVKPQVMETVLSPLKDTLAASKPLLISIAAGITVDTLTQWAGELSIVRCMPNTPALVQLGASGLYANEAVSDEQKQLTETILNAVGVSEWVSEEGLIDAVTAVSGSAPAYFFLLMEAMQAAGEAQGLSAETAKALTLQTALGAATMAKTSDLSAAQLRKNVTSPGGTTEQAIACFENGDFRGLVNQAMLDCAEHSRKLAKQLGAK